MLRGFVRGACFNGRVTRDIPIAIGMHGLYARADLRVGEHTGCAQRGWINYGISLMDAGWYEKQHR